MKARERGPSAPMLMVGAALLFSLMAVCVKWASALYGAGELVFYRSLVGALWMLLEGASAHSARGLALLLAIGLLATTAQMMMTRAYRIGRTLSNASLQYLGIVFSFVLGVLLFDDPVTWMALAGMGLIVIAGLAATLLRSHQQHDNPETRSPPNPT